MKKKLLVSFSGGETSAYMAQWLWKHKQDEYDMIFVFANTGLENEETLRFVRRCEDHFGFPVVWIETKVDPKMGVGNSFTVVNYSTASRNGEPFESIIKKHGIPNQNSPHCTRELKKTPIEAYAKSIGWKFGDYDLAIGIRTDEMDRMSRTRLMRRLKYPLIHDIPMTKPKINFWWSQQSFRLELKGYQGNCITCWKKSDKKLYQIAKENEMQFLFFAKMELRYGKYTPESRLKLMEARGELPKYPIRFFRKNRSAEDIINESKQYSGSVIDDSIATDETESCEVFTECGIDN